MYTDGYHSLGPDMYVPTPGRVQYYRAEALPFVPAEIKTQLRFPKAYAESQINLRYLDSVRDITQSFINKKIDQNYFTGESSVSMSATLSEIEVLHSAGETVKSLAQSGALGDIHNRCDALKEASESQYINMRDKIENIVQAIQTKEDDIYESLIEDEVTGIYTHEQDDASVFRLGSALNGMASVTNLMALDAAIKNANDKESLQKDHNKLVALLGAKIKATDALISLQSAYCEHVEIGDQAANSDLANFQKKAERYQHALGKHAGHSDETANLLASQIDEVSADLESVSKVFADYNAVNQERTAIFANFSGK